MDGARSWSLRYRWDRLLYFRNSLLTMPTNWQLLPPINGELVPTVPSFGTPPKDDALPQISPTSMLMAAAEAQRSMPRGDGPELQTGKVHPKKKLRVIR